MTQVLVRRLCGRAATLLVFAAACAVFAPGCGGVKGSGNRGAAVRKVAHFKAIEIGGVVDVDVTAGRAQSVKVTGDDNLVPLVITRVHDGRLRIYTKKPVRPELDLVVHITVPDIDFLSVGGAGHVTLRDISNSLLKLELSGAAKLTVSGATHRVDLNLSGAGTINARALRAETARVTVSGAGDADVYASAGLVVYLSGAGTVRYYGNPPNVFKHISGIGKLEKR